MPSKFEKAYMVASMRREAAREAAAAWLASPYRTLDLGRTTAMVEICCYGEDSAPQVSIEGDISLSELDAIHKWAHEMLDDEDI